MTRAAEGSRRLVASVLAWSGGTALALTVFDFLSARSDLARRGWLVGNGDLLARPPIYGQFHPHVAGWIFAAIAVAAVAGVLAWLAANTRIDRRVFVAASMLVFFGLAVAVAFVGGDRAEATAGMRTDPDTRVVGQLGVREFVRSYPDLVGEQLRGVHSLTHPPGRVVHAWILDRAFGNHPLARSVATAGLASLVAIPAWLLARELHGERVARHAVVLLVTAPGPILFAFASFEAVEMVALVTAGWLFARALRDDGDPGRAAGAGMVLGLAFLFTYSAAIVAAFLGLYAIFTRRRATVVRVLAGATAGGLGALAVLFLALGFDPFAVSTTTREFNSALPPCPDPITLGTGPCALPRPYGYWLAGSPAGWLTLAGVPVAGLGLRALFAERSRLLIAIILPNVILYVLPRDVTGLLPGELERTVLWAVPFTVVAAGVGLARAAGGRSGRVLTVGIALFAAGQAIAIEALYRTGW